MSATLGSKLHTVGTLTDTMLQSSETCLGVRLEVSDITYMLPAQPLRSTCAGVMLLTVQPSTAPASEENGAKGAGDASQVVPSGYGQRLPWYFLASPSYWRRNTGGGMPKLGGKAASGEGALLGEAAEDAAVVIRHLCKDFQTTDGYTKRAVDDLSLEVAGSKVTALLGESLLSTD